MNYKTSNVLSKKPMMASRVIIRSIPVDTQTVFQAKGFNHQVSLKDIDEALSMTHGMRTDTAAECFYSLGIDYYRAIQYYNIVEQLDHNFYMSTSNSFFDFLCTFLRSFNQSK